MRKPSKSLKLTRAIAAVTAFFCVASSAGWAANLYSTPDFDKLSTYPIEDSYAKPLPPNVLFLLDTGSPMVMSPNGTLPTVDTEPDADERVAMLAECAYGSGSRPFILNGAERAEVSYTRYGRDLKESNNIIGDPYCYYSPYPDRPYYLTFRDSAWANWDGTDPAPAAAASTAMTDAERTALLAHIANKTAVREPELVKHLVPNDSRMYQMKLVMWRLLGEENQALLSRMKAAMAISYQEDNYPTAFLADFYKYSPYGYVGNSYTVPHNGGTKEVRFVNGTGPNWATGIPGEGDYSFYNYAYAGIIRDFYDYPPYSPEWITVNRAVMKIPFDYLYKSTDEGFYPTRNLALFRSYLDGIEAGDGSALTNPEFFADGKTPLATAIYGRDYHVSGGGTAKANSNHDAIRFGTANGSEKEQYAWGYITFLDSIISDDMGGPDIRAGRATGSVIDFFSPLAQNLTFKDSVINADGTTENTVGYFPVTASCQNNWVVVLTAGNDSDPYAITAAEAVEKLYKSTKRMRGREWNKTTKKWEEREFDMDYGVRTLVVGFVDENNPGSQGLRDSLGAMAQWGDPNDDGVNISRNQDAKPYYANDVPSLITKLKEVLMRINSTPYASSAPIITKSVTGMGVEAQLYEPGYTIKAFDQWEGEFAKYGIIHEEGKEDRIELAWELGGNMKDAAAQRNIFVGYRGGGHGIGNADNNTQVDNLNAVSGNKLKSAAGIPDGVVPGTSTTYEAAFREWLRYYPNTREAKGSMLGDMEHGGFAVVGEPAPYSGIASRPKRVYLHTNRGVLHAVDDGSGQEVWGFIPPNIFEKSGNVDASRILPIKFHKDTKQWKSGDGITSLNSSALDLLDGSLVAKEMRDRRRGGEYRTILIGSMGFGGNGLYAIDVTEAPNTIKTAGNGYNEFKWALENVRYGNRNNILPPYNSVNKWLTFGTGNQDGDYAGYRDLGLTIQAPALVSADLGTGRGGERYLDLGLLPGGLGYNLGADDQGKALFVFDPFTGKIERKITGETTGRYPGFEDPTAPSQWQRGRRSLGMIVGPVIYINDGSMTATSFYTSDSNGNVLFADIRNKPLEQWKMKSVFQLLSSPATGKKPISISKALLRASGGNPKQEWIFGGTADLMVTDQGPGRKMENAEQYIWGHNLSVASGDVETSGLFQLAYTQAANDSSRGVSPDLFTPAPKGSAGWALKLLAVSPVNRAEYVTTSPYLYDGVLFVSTFIAKPQQDDVADPGMCPDVGNSKLYMLDPFTGAGLWPGGFQAVVLHNIKISGISAYKGKLYLAMKPFKAGAALDAAAQSPELKFETPNLLSLNKGLPKGAPDVTPDVPYIKYWKEY